MVKLDDTRIAVFIAATETGKSNGSGGNGVFATTRMKNMAVKNDPNSIASETMNSSTPSTCRCTRELRFARGGPWCSWATGCACVMLADSMRLLVCLVRPECHGGRDVAGHVLDRNAGGPPGAVDQVSAQPVRPVARQRRDHDLVGGVVLVRVDDRRQRVGMRDVPTHHEAHRPQLAQRLLE